MKSHWNDFCLFKCLKTDNNPTLFIQACAVMALERVPADIRKQGGVARMSDPKVGKEIIVLTVWLSFFNIFMFLL